MSLGNLDGLLNPAAVAVIGASHRPGTAGTVLLDKLLDGGYEGEVYPVNPKYDELKGRRCYHRVSDLPCPPDLALLATPPPTVPRLVRELGRMGTRAAVVVAGRYHWPRRWRGRDLTAVLLAAARPYGLRLVGPNALGVVVPRLKLDAGLGSVCPAAGHLAFVSQSGAITSAVLEWSAQRGSGLSCAVGLGDMCDVSLADLLDWLNRDVHTQAILLCLESVADARAFLSAARAAARVKPVLVVKAGRQTRGARAARSHTGVLASPDAVYDAAFRQAGLLRVDSLPELLVTLDALALDRPAAGERVAVLGNGGSLGVFALDALEAGGGRLADLSGASLKRLRELAIVEGRPDNPVNLRTAAPQDHYRQALAVLLADRGVDAVVVLNSPNALVSASQAADGVLSALGEQGRCRPPVFAAWLGVRDFETLRERFIQAGVLCFPTPAEAVQALLARIRLRRNKALLMQTPEPLPSDNPPDLQAARRVVAEALKARRRWLDGVQTRTLLTAYGIPMVETVQVVDADGAASVARRLGGPVALKVWSPDIVHKAAAGGVALDLNDPDEVRIEAEYLRRRMAVRRPEARLKGFLVQPMLRRPNARELIVGMTVDPQFGPVILFGHGGAATEAVGDTALSLPPLNLHLAHELMARTRVLRQLEGNHDWPGADLDALALVLVRVAQLAVDLAEVVELEINPLLADEQGVVAVDARVRVARAAGPAATRLAIRPYPRELEETLTLDDGRTLSLRPLRPEDEPALQTLFSRLSAQEIRMRFMHAMNELPHDSAARLTQLDYDREMALGLFGREDDGEALYGVVRLSQGPDREQGEFAILVWRRFAGLGLGVLLMRRIIDYARGRGVKCIWGDVLADNEAMLALARRLGFEDKPDPREPGLRRVELHLEA